MKKMSDFLRKDIDTYKAVFELYCFPCVFQIISFKKINCD